MFSKPILIMAGGTGGHIYPALAVADHLRDKGFSLFWLGTSNGLEARVVPGKGYQLLTINVSGLRGKGLMKWIQAPVVICRGLIQSLQILIHLKPAVVLGMGGFVSGPGGLATWIMRIPLCIHEQNAIAGMTNCMLAPLANLVMEAFPNTFADRFNAKVTGNPVRSEIRNSVPAHKTDNSGKKHTLQLLVLGGSQGARKLNQIIPETLAIIPENIHIEVRHQTGENHYVETEAIYRNLNCVAKLEPYIENMAEAYIWADIVVCRSGAITVAELSAAGVPSILVPYPFAVDDHQTANARFLSDAGAAILIQEKDLTKECLCQLLCNFFESHQNLADMAVRARKMDKPDATQLIATLCLEVAHAG